MKKILLLMFFLAFDTCLLQSQNPAYTYSHGGIIRLNRNAKNIFLTFTGHEFGDGGGYITKILKKNGIKASFFFTGDFYRNPVYKELINNLHRNGNYLGAHSDKHLLYCDWDKRDSIFVSADSFKADLSNNYKEMERNGIKKKNAKYFLPPYEWYNDTIVKWTKEMNLELVNFTPGTYSNADYTVPSMGKRYLSSDTIYKRILRYEQKDEDGLNGFILLLHVGTDPERTDKMYYKIGSLIRELKKRGYKFKTFSDIE